MVFPARTLAVIVLGSTGMSAWGQVDTTNAGRGVPGAATAPARVTTAVAAFPDVVETDPHRTRGPTHELLPGNPYDDELARLKAHQNLFGTSIDEENPYAEQIRLANPYALEMRFRSPYTEESAPQRGLRSLDRDFENPYGETTALAARPPLEPDFENPYGRTGR